MLNLHLARAYLHFNQHDGLPDIIGECRATAILIGFSDAKFRVATNIERAGLTEGLKEPVEKDLRLAFFVSGNVLLTPRNEFR